MRPPPLAPIIGGQLGEVSRRRARHGERTREDTSLIPKVLG
jgi:hypothetical protein